MLDRDEDQDCFRPELPRCTYQEPNLPNARETQLTVLSLLRQAAFLRQAGRVAETAPIMRAATKLMPQNPDLQHDLALTLIHMEKLAEALPHLDAALALNPAHAPAHLNRGKVLERLGQPGFLQAYQRAAVLAPHVAEVHGRLASALEQEGHRGRALAAYRTAASLSPAGSVESHIYCARVALIEDDLGTAETALRAVLAIDPESAVARGMLGRVLSALGQFAQAERELETALRHNPASVALYYNLVQTRRLTADDAALIARMRGALTHRAPAAARMRLHHALAKAHDDIGDYAAAAAELGHAGALRAAHHPMDRAALRALTERIVQLFTPAYLARADHGRDLSPLPVLVLGLPRSGTTLTERILARHPAIAGAGEHGFWDSHGATLLSGLAAHRAADLRGDAATYLAALRAAAESRGCPRFIVDKNPFNHRWALLAHLALPNARIVHCRRHRADNALSIMMAALRPQALFGTAPEDLLFCIEQHDILMRHARAVLAPAQMYEVDYDALVTAPEAQIRGLLAFLGLEFDPACLAPELDERAVMTASVWQVRQPINTQSIGRWRHYAALLEAFAPPAPSAAGMPPPSYNDAAQTPH
jgi:tetratricopeptide (TPR) repeat protein